MSEANNVWRIEAEGREREIELSHSTMTGKIVVTLDGKAVAEGRMLVRKKPLAFDVDGHTARVTVEYIYGGFGARSSLHFDNRYIEPLSH